MSKIEKNKEEEAKSEISCGNTTIPNLTGFSLLNGLRSPFHQVKMKRKRQRMKRWLRPDGKCRKNEKTKKEKVAENRW